MSSKLQMVLFLSLIAISAIIFYHSWATVFTVFLAFAVTYTSDSIFIRFRKIKPFPLEASLVSGLIIGLLVSPSLPIYFVIVAAILAMVSKNFIRFNNRHIFNPAGFGLFITSIIFTKGDVSWWGVSFQALHPSLFPILFFLILLSPGFVSVIKLQRYRIIASFWTVYVVILLILHSHLIIDPTAIFFSLVMLPEPMTTPNYPGRQLVFGATVAAISVISGSFLIGLLSGNLIFYILNYVLQLRVSSTA